MELFMNNIDLIWNTLKFLDKKDIQQINYYCNSSKDHIPINCKINKYQLKEISSLLIMDLNTKKKFLTKWIEYKNFMDKHQYFNHYSDKIWEYPVTKFKKFLIGPTGYIDNISDRDINFSLVRGIDSYQRHFIVIKYKLINDINNSEINFIKDNIYTLTIFQRYSDGKTWCKAGINQGPLLDDTNTCLTPPEIISLNDRITSIINNQFFYLKIFRTLSNNDDFINLKIFCQLENILQ